MLHYLIHLVGRLLRVRGVRYSCVTVFTFGVYVETRDYSPGGHFICTAGHAPHNSLRYFYTSSTLSSTCVLLVTLYNILLVLHILLR